MLTPETEFRHTVEDLLRALSAQLDQIDDDDLDPVLSDGVLSCSFEERGGTFVLSQQVPVRELWLSANRTAWHFVCEEGRWRERNTREDMLQLLSRLFSEKLGMPVALRYP